MPRTVGHVTTHANTSFPHDTLATPYFYSREQRPDPIKDQELLTNTELHTRSWSIAINEQRDERLTSDRN